MYFLETDAAALAPILIALLAVTVPVIIIAIIIFIKLIVKQAKRMREAKDEVGYEEYFGGADNITNIEVVLSRVNVTVKDLEKVKLEDLKNLGMGILVSGNVVKCANQEFADKVSKQLKTK